MTCNAFCIYLLKVSLFLFFLPLYLRSLLSSPLPLPVSVLKRSSRTMNPSSNNIIINTYVLQNTSTHTRGTCARARSLSLPLLFLSLLIFLLFLCFSYLFLIFIFIISSLSLFFLSLLFLFAYLSLKVRSLCLRRYCVRRRDNNLRLATVMDLMRHMIESSPMNVRRVQNRPSKFGTIVYGQSAIELGRDS